MQTLAIRQAGFEEPSAELRLRGWTLLERTYERARRMMWFLRWDEGDADQILPPLRDGGRGKRRKKRELGPHDGSPST